MISTNLGGRESMRYDTVVAVACSSIHTHFKVHSNIFCPMHAAPCSRRERELRPIPQSAIHLSMKDIIIDHSFEHNQLKQSMDTIFNNSIRLSYVV
jgi:hypothetical protein